VVFEHFLSSRITEHSVVHHYAALVLPFAMAASVLGLARLTRRGRAHLAGPVSCVALLAALASQWLNGPLVGAGVLQGLGMPEALKQDEYDLTLEPWRDAMLARVPRTGGVVAGFELLPRFTDREGLHSLHHLLAGHYTMSHRAYAVPTNVGAVFADLGAGSLFKWVDDGTAARWRSLVAGSDLHPLDAANDLVLYTHGARDTVPLWDVSEPAAPLSPPVVYDRQVAFTGSELGAARVHPGERVPIRTHWRRAADTDRFFLTEIAVRDESGEPRLYFWRYLGYMQHPLREWPSERSVCETYHLAIPANFAPGKYRVAYRLWWRRDGQAICEPDEPHVHAAAGYVDVGGFEVSPR
jgi:hypothetical protein